MHGILGTWTNIFVFTKQDIKKSYIKICNIEQDKFPLKDNFFDLVLCTEVLEHLPHSPASALKEMYRVARPGGLLLVTTPNIAHLINRIKLLLGKNVSYPLSHILEEDNIYHRHNREYTLPELAALCEHAGWKLASQGDPLQGYAGYFISYTPNRKRNKPESFFTKAAKWLYYCFVSLFPPFQDTLLIIAEK